MATEEGSGENTDIFAARPWVKSYPAGVPKNVDDDAIPTLADLIRDIFERHAGKPAMESFGVRMTYRDVARTADAVSGWLLQQGVGKGDRVALMMPNVMAYVPTLFGTLLAGAVAVGVNPLYTARELVHVLRDSGATVLFVLENFGATVEAALADIESSGGTKPKVVVVSAGDLLGLKGRLIDFVARHVKKIVPASSLPGAIRFAAVLAEGAGAPGARPEIAPSDMAFLQYTGGTTGVAKGAMLTHRNVAANILQSEIWLKTSLQDKPNPVTVSALPLYHIFALLASALVMSRFGACQILIANPRDIKGLVKTLKKRRFNVILVINTLARALLNNPDFRRLDFSGLRLSVAGGMAVQSRVADEWKAATGRPLIEGYGLSETSPVVCLNRADIADFTGAIGYPLPSTEISIRDEAGNVVRAGQKGELCVRGPQVMAGYWRRPDETAKVMTHDGFFRTGDVATMDAHGLVTLVDRLKDMILVSGFNVYPNEVEDVIAAHPAVAEVAVVGRRDEKSGEAVVAYVVSKPDTEVDEAALREHCRKSLTAYKVPREVHFIEAIPKSNVGKILRKDLRLLADGG
ncbi:Long-chain-fatty-acid-CoA ligase [Hartmannibacter diazotrophicus]|uniref:Long-chain-fatty-acid--CoA ligase n=1 Tax=Hartmannibacter diazotrophicus TaxID=1482074 RepID=A0A2C9D1G9_9HYPH|nr:AMP-binding protein [Hartmannibacter diazotrophicus]SON53651.1 Long-chain-fatty-acid-CoA ligase [Hartmannibacter diazotrophicus]